MPAKILSDSLLGRLMREGKTDAQVVRYLAEHENITVTRQAISAWRKRRGQDMRPLSPRAMPWTLREEHRQLEPAKVIRWHARVERGDPIPDADRVRYERAIAVLKERDAVFDYDPNSDHGWRLTPRRPGVDTGIIREPAPSKVAARS